MPAKVSVKRLIRLIFDMRTMLLEEYNGIGEPGHPRCEELSKMMRRAEYTLQRLRENQHA